MIKSKLSLLLVVLVDLVITREGADQLVEMILQSRSAWSDHLERLH